MKLTTDDLKRAVLDSLKSIVGEARDDLASMLEEIEGPLQQFIRDGDAAQIEVIAFRLRTLARGHQLAAIRATENAIYAAIGTALRIAVKVLV